MAIDHTDKEDVGNDPAHNPGPWTVVRKDYVAAWYEVLGTKKPIAFGIDRKVDAELVAAAPLMLRVLKSVAGVLGDTRDYGSKGDEVAVAVGNSLEKLKLADGGLMGPDLIAAAPKMFEALKKIKDLRDNLDYWFPFTDQGIKEFLSQVIGVVDNTLEGVGNDNERA